MKCNPPYPSPSKFKFCPWPIKICYNSKISKCQRDAQFRHNSFSQQLSRTFSTCLHVTFSTSASPIWISKTKSLSAITQINQKTKGNPWNINVISYLQAMAKIFIINVSNNCSDFSVWNAKLFWSFRSGDENGGGSGLWKLDTNKKWHHMQCFKLQCNQQANQPPLKEWQSTQHKMNLFVQPPSRLTLTHSAASHSKLKWTLRAISVP